MKSIIRKLYIGLMSISMTVFIMSESAVSGQEISDTALLKTLYENTGEKEKFSSFLKNSESEVTIVISTFFIVYKEFFSSQDVDACVFSPSCSGYMMGAIRKKGFIGILDGLDRLTRCHSLVGRHDYAFDPITKKYYDPL